MNPLRGKRKIAACLVGLTLSMSGLAADTRPVAAGLASALEQAWRLHPMAAGLDARDAEAGAARDIANGLTPEPGSITLGNRNDRLNRNLGKQEYEIELATPLWLPGQKAAREAEAESQIDEATARRAALRLQIAGELRETWWSLAAARNAKILAELRLQTASTLAKDVDRRYRVGELSRIDANLAQTEVHAAESELIETEATLLQAEQSLRAVTGAPAPADMHEEAPAAVQKPDELQNLSAQHPLLVAAAAAARSARAKLKVAGESRRASPELALRVIRERGDFADPFANNIAIALKIPFSSGARVRHESSGAQADADQADAEMLRTQTRVQFDTERAQRAVLASQRQLVMARERRALAAENLRLSEKAFALGESDLATLLRIRAAAYDADAFFYQQSVARAAAISTLNQAFGVLP